MYQVTATAIINENERVRVMFDTDRIHGWDEISARIIRRDRRNTQAVNVTAYSFNEA